MADYSSNLEMMLQRIASGLVLALFKCIRCWNTFRFVFEKITNFHWVLENFKELWKPKLRLEDIVR